MSCGREMDTLGRQAGIGEGAPHRKATLCQIAAETSRQVDIFPLLHPKRFSESVQGQERK
jgi:hypothetical protein